MSGMNPLPLLVAGIMSFCSAVAAQCDCIGELMWCKDAVSQVWWPCEAIDPFHPPPGFQFTAEHVTALDQHERRKYMPAELYQQVLKVGVGSNTTEVSEQPGIAAGDVKQNASNMLFCVC